MIGDAIRSGIRDAATKRVSIVVTGFSRAGKTVCIGALAQALLTAEAWIGGRGQGPLRGLDRLSEMKLTLLMVAEEVINRPRNTGEHFLNG